MVRREQRAHGNRLVNSTESLTTEIGIQLILFGSFGGQANLGHFHNGFKGVLTGSSFCAQHDGIGAV